MGGGVCNRAVSGGGGVVQLGGRGGGAGCNRGMCAILTWDDRQYWGGGGIFT